MDGREVVEYPAEMTNEEYRINLSDYEVLIIEAVHNIREKWILEQIYRFIKNIIKED